MIRNTFFSYFSQEFLITEWLRLERISVGLLVQHPCSSKITYSRLPRPCPYGFWRAPRMETQQPLQATCARQCSITTQWRSASWCLDRALCSSLFPLPLTLSLGTTEKSMTVLFAPSLQLSIHIDKISWTLSSPGWTVPTLSCEERWSSLFIFLVALLLNLSSSFLSLLYWGDTRTVLQV